MLDDKIAAKAAPKDKDYQLSDSGGRHLLVTKAVMKSWRLKYCFNKKERLLVLDRFPSLKTVEARDTAKPLLASGKDPSLQAKHLRLANIERAGQTFERFARQRYDSQKAQWKEVHSNDVITSMEKDLFPDFGERPIAGIDEVGVVNLTRIALYTMHLSLFGAQLS